MKTNNTTRNENETRVINAIKNGTHEENALCVAAGMIHEYSDFCMALYTLQRAGLIIYIDGEYYLSDEETREREAATADRMEREHEARKAAERRNAPDFVTAQRIANEAAAELAEQTGTDENAAAYELTATAGTRIYEVTHGHNETLRSHARRAADRIAAALNIDGAAAADLLAEVLTYWRNNMIVREAATLAETVEVENETTTAYHHTTAARVAQVCKTIAEAVGVFSGSQYPAADMVQDLNRFAKWEAAAEDVKEANPAAPFWFAVREQGSESGTREHCKERCSVLGRPVYVIKVEREDLPGLFTLKVRVSSRATAEAVTKANEKPDTRKQFADIKTKYHDALLLFSCGDHYETYEEDAQTIAAAFGLTISEEDGHKLAAFPASDLSEYLPALVRKGHRVAICDQLEAPRKIERRRITETVGAQATEGNL